MIRANLLVPYTIFSVHPATSSGPSPIVLDAGAPLTCSGMSSLKQGSLAYGFDYDAVMSTMQPSKMRFAFGSTALSSVGIAPLWLVSPGGQIHIAERQFVDHESLPILLMDVLYIRRSLAWIHAIVFVHVSEFQHIRVQTNLEAAGMCIWSYTMHLIAGI
jgi:hypothetical protein